MYIRTTTRKYKGKTYTNYLLVESLHTPKGPRQKVVCSLGDLKPRPKEEWLKLARKVEAKLSGKIRSSTSRTGKPKQSLAKSKRKRPPKERRGEEACHRNRPGDLVTVHTDEVTTE